MPSVKWRWKCKTSGKNGTVQATSGVLLAAHNATKQHDRTRIPACVYGHCISQLTNAETNEVWLPNRELGLTTWKKASSEDIARSKHKKHRPKRGLL